jgi:hypothetical protein
VACLVASLLVFSMAGTSASAGHPAAPRQYPPTSSSTPGTTRPPTSAPTTFPAPSTTEATLIAVSDIAVVPGQDFAVTIEGCDPGELVTFRLIRVGIVAERSTICIPRPVARSNDVATGDGIATVVFDEVFATGAYEIVVTGDRGFFAEGTIDIVESLDSTSAPSTTGGGGALPTTGSAAIDAYISAAIVLLLTGGGILVVSRVRRRAA